MDLMTFSSDSLEEPSQYLTMKSWDINSFVRFVGYKFLNIVNCFTDPVTLLPLKTLLPDLEFDHGTNQPW